MAEKAYSITEMDLVDLWRNAYDLGYQIGKEEEDLMHGRIQRIHAAKIEIIEDLIKKRDVSNDEY